MTKSSKPTQLIVVVEDRHVDGRTVFRLKQPYRHPLLPEYTVPKGFQTDFGSVPKIAWSIVSPGEIAHSATVHDYLTSDADGVRELNVPRKMADQFLRDAVTEEVGPKTGMIVYAAVRAYAILARKK